MIRIRQLKVPLEQRNLILKKISKILGIKENDILDYKIVKESIDARKKNNILLIYEVDVKLKHEEKILKTNKSEDIFKTPDEDYKFLITGTQKLDYKPVIVGSGPSGLMCAYFLAKYGYNPIIIERGECVEDRIKSIEEFWEKGNLNINSNVQFGEGGAGTFSDGKLNTLVKDKCFRGKKVFEIFIECGAPKEIMYLNKPHIGTDILRDVIKNIREKIISFGGEFRFNSCLTDLEIENNQIQGIIVNQKEEIKTNLLILAIGHSARDTFEMLLKRNIKMESKPFAVGVRIEHPQEMINESQYGMKYHSYLKQASYKLTYKAKNNRGVYSFCMCPGGYVVNASSEQNRLVVNGMSNYKRESTNANSAIVVTVSQKDFGFNPLDGIAFQRKLEEYAYLEGRGTIPIQLYKDFKDNKTSKEFGNFKTVTKGKTTFSNLNNIFPNYITDSIKEAIPEFGKKIKGFDMQDAILLGVESRTSSPVKIPRDDNYFCNIYGVMPCGEGAGYAGGITTSAIDGVKIAEKIAQIFEPFDNK